MGRFVITWIKIELSVFKVYICRSGARLLLVLLAIDVLHVEEGGDLGLCPDPEVESSSDSGVEGRL